MGLRRRIILVAAGTVTLCLLLVGGLLHLHHQLHRQLRQQRDQAVAMVADGYYSEARGVLEGYLHRVDPDDVEAMSSLSQALLGEPRPSQGDRVHALRLLRRVAERDQGDLLTHLRLLSLERELGFDNAVLITAARVRALTDDSAHVRSAREVEAEALSRLGRHEEALSAAAALVSDLSAEGDECCPAEVVRAHRLVLEVLAAGPWPSQRVVDEARSWRQTNENDVRFEVLLAFACNLTDRSPQASEILDGLSERSIPDPATAQLLAGELDALDRFDEATSVLKRSAAALDDPGLDVSLVTRLWDRGGADDIEVMADYLERRLSGTDAPERDAEASVLLAMQAMALTRLGRRDESEAWIEALRRRSGTDSAAAAWVIYLTGVFEQQATAQTVMRRCRQALIHDPDNAYVRFALGEVLAQRGELEAAVIEWLRVASIRQAWGQPRLRASEAMRELGLATSAVELAEAALLRTGPENVRGRIALAEAKRLSQLREGGEPPEQLLELVETIQRYRPFEPRTLPLYADLLAKAQRREDASEVILEALERPLSESTLLRLARVSREHGLGLADACEAQSEALHGRTAALAYARAVRAWNQGRADRALAELRPPGRVAARVADGAGDVTRRLEWRLAEARFLDYLDHAEADAVWRALLEDYPESLPVQRAAIEAVVVWSDRQLADQVIDGLRRLTGDGAVSWRLARARWLLEADGVATERAVEAALLLAPVRRAAPVLVEPRLWLARALVVMGEKQGAVAELRGAIGYAPRHQPTLLELARLLSEQGQTEQALAHLNAVVSNPTSTVPQLQAAAKMLVRLRGWDEAVAALTRAAEAGGRSPGELLLAGLAAERPGEEGPESGEHE